MTLPGILVGFTETEQIREEGRGFVDLCVEVIEGSLETEIEMTLTTTDGTARGTYVCYCIGASIKQIG